jgi:hypothetical protein
MPASNSLMLDIDPDVSTLPRLMDDSYSVTDRNTIANTTSISIVVFSYMTLTTAAKDIVSKINQFKTLKENWDSYGALPTSLNAINGAINFVRMADRNLLPFYFTAPGPNGELVIEFRRGHKEAAAYFNPDSTTELILSENNQTILEGSVEANYRDLLQFINT